MSASQKEESNPSIGRDLKPVGNKMFLNKEAGGLAVKKVFEKLENAQLQTISTDPVVILDTFLLNHRYFPSEIEADKKLIENLGSFFVNVLASNSFKFESASLFEILERCEKLEKIYPQYSKVWKKVRKNAVGSVSDKENLRQAIMANKHDFDIIIKHLCHIKF